MCSRIPFFISYVDAEVSSPWWPVAPTGLDVARDPALRAQGPGSRFASLSCQVRKAGPPQARSAPRIACAFRCLLGEVICHPSHHRVTVLPRVPSLPVISMIDLAKVCPGPTWSAWTLLIASAESEKTV